MDEIGIRSKRKSPASPIPDEHPSEKKRMDLEEREGNEEKMNEKQDEKTETQENPEDVERKLKEMLTTEEFPSGSILSQVLPTIKKDQNKPISDEDLEKLFYALCGDTGKQYDSDDSIISDIDHMDAEEIAAKDKSFRNTIESLKMFPNEIENLRKIANIGNETESEREERRRMIREMKNRFKTKEEQEIEEEKRIVRKKRLEKSLDSVVQVFDKDFMKISQNADSPRLMTCRQFSRCLEIMAECVPEDIINEDGTKDICETIKEMDSKKLEKNIKSHGIKANFYHGNKSLGEYLKRRVRKLLVDDNIIGVIEGDRYGFHFTAKEYLIALETYFTSNSSSLQNMSNSSSVDQSMGNSSSLDHLSIKIRQFVASCYYVTRSQNKDFVINDNLKFAMFG